MFDQPLATVVAAAVALAGTLVGIIIAQRRWAHERGEARFGRFESDRQDIYKGLWDKVEGVNAALRRQRVDKSGSGQLVADLNEFILRNGAHIDNSDRVLVNRYVNAVKKFHSVVMEAGLEAKIPYGDTQDIPSEVVKAVKDLATAANEANRLREELRANVRTILAGRP